MSDYKPKKRKDPFTPIWCVFCHEKIAVGETYHYIKSLSAGVRPVCKKCAKVILKVAEDEEE